jgi:hypothetical protein
MRGDRYCVFGNNILEFKNTKLIPFVLPIVFYYKHQINESLIYL